MSVHVTERVKTYIEYTPEGAEIAKGLEEKLRLQGALRGRTEDTNYIILEAEYYMTVNAVSLPIGEKGGE